jgi:hypothetical protein
MQTILHIGMPKTGTTSLQNTFAASARALQDHSVCYPTGLASSSCNHRILANAIMPAERFPRHMAAFRNREVADGLYRELLDSIDQGVRRLSPRVLLLSSESLFRGPRTEYRDTFEKTVEGFGGNDVRVVAYLRSPSGIYLALLQQKVKASHTLLPLRSPSYLRSLRRYGKLFGRKSVSPRVFERDKLQQNDIVHDFHHHFLEPHGVPLSALNYQGDKNTSLSGESMALCVLFWQRFFPDADNLLTRTSRQLVQTLGNADKAAGAGRPRLKSSVVAFLDSLAVPQLTVLKEKWGIKFSDYDYESTGPRPASHSYVAREIPKRISDIVELNMNTLRAISNFAAKAPRFALVREYRDWFLEVARTAPTEI